MNGALSCKSITSSYGPFAATAAPLLAAPLPDDLLLVAPARLAAEQLTGAQVTLSNRNRRGPASSPLSSICCRGPSATWAAASGACQNHGKLLVRDSMGLSLTFDHHVVSGAPAADFLDD
ncbi:2-oxo acid dehydrogenase subunit E2 [Pseudomonas sp.]|uniref:2-oxo acid dehydrogenase subunit E2 n=1 Tax=Pseudomonas sp. TaxID=306 RepID=UPI00345BC796